MTCVWPDERCEAPWHRLGLCESHFQRAITLRRLPEFEQYRVKTGVPGPSGKCLSKPPKWKCGTRGLYSAGCRGDRCREAAREQTARRREAARVQLRPDMRWMTADPPCLGRDAVFFPLIDADIDCGYRRWDRDGAKGHHAKAVDPYAAARAICATCPMRDDCLQTALAYGAPNQFGFVGGLDPWERRRLLPRVQRKVAA